MDINNKKILVIRYGTFGDSVLMGAFYRELKNNAVNSTIDALVDKKAKSILVNCPYIDNFVDLKSERRQYRDFFHYFNLFKNYDVIFFLKPNSLLSSIAYFAGVKTRIGFDIKKNKFLNVKVPYDEKRHELDCYFDSLRVLGIEIKNKKTELFIDPICEDNIKKYLNYENKKIVIQIFASSVFKNWKKDYWIEIIRYLVEQNNIVYCLGSNKDCICYEKILEEFQDKSKIFNLAGKISIQETIALVKNSNLAIGIDSCLMHIAAAFDIPSVLIHGPTSIARWKPVSEKCMVVSKNYSCSPCFFQTNVDRFCTDEPKCLFDISPDEVKTAILNQL